MTAPPSSNRTLPFNLVTLSGLVGYFPRKWKKRLEVLIGALRQKSARAGARPRQRLPASVARTNVLRFDMEILLSG